MVHRTRSGRLATSRHGTPQRGFSYFTVLLIVAILGGGLALTGEVWSTAAQREKEIELLFIGQQYRKAIARYYLSGPKQYPRQLADLIKDPRMPATTRYLRQLYPDPVTGSNEWGIVTAPDGGVQGVHSKSDKEPLKRSGFRVRDATFENAKTYADWRFVYSPQAAARGNQPAAGAPSTPSASSASAPIAPATVPGARPAMPQPARN